MPLVLDNFVVTIEVVGEIAQQECINVYNYITPLEPVFSDLSPMSVSLRQNFLSDIALLQTVSMNYKVFNMEVLNTTTFQEKQIVLEGNVIGDRMPTFTAVSVKYPRSTKETRSGYKRLPGILALEVVGDNLLESTRIAYQAACDGMVLPLPVPSTGQDAFPIILGKRFEPSGELKPVTEWEWQYITSAIVFDRVSTQNSRKVGVGA